MKNTETPVEELVAFIEAGNSESSREIFIKGKMYIIDVLQLNDFVVQIHIRKVRKRGDEDDEE